MCFFKSLGFQQKPLQGNHSKHSQCDVMIKTQIFNFFLKRKEKGKESKSIKTGDLQEDNSIEHCTELKINTLVLLDLPFLFIVSNLY